ADASGIVENCGDDRALASVLIGGGDVSFNCGDVGASVTISLRDTIAIGDDTRIDGGGKITLSGHDTIRLFTVSPGASLQLRNIELEAGFSAGDGGAVYNAGFLALDGATIRDSNAKSRGGAIATIGDADITDATLRDNGAVNGGAIAAIGTHAHV